MTNPQPYAELTHAERCELLAVDGGWRKVRTSPAIVKHGSKLVWSEWCWELNSNDGPVVTPLPPDPYNTPADHWALRGRMDEQGTVLHYITRSTVNGKDAVVYLYDQNGTMKGASFDDHAAEVAAICEAYGRIRGLWL